MPSKHDVLDTLEAELLTWFRDDLKALCRQLGLDGPQVALGR